MDSKSSTSSASMDKVLSRSLDSKKMLVMILLTVLAACAITGTSAASVTADCPIRSSDPSMVELFYYSDFVVLAKVLRHIKANPDDQSFTAQMELYCIFKGKDLPRTLNVSNAGKKEGMCFEREFKVGSSYLVYLRKGEDARFTPAFRHHPDTYKDEIFSMCDVNVSAPIGDRLNKDEPEVTCVDSYNEDEYDYPEGTEYEDYEAGTDCIPPFDPTTPEPESESYDNTVDNNNSNNGGEKEEKVHVTFTGNKIYNHDSHEKGTEVSDNGNSDEEDDNEQGREVSDIDNNDNEDNDVNAGNSGKEVPYRAGKPGEVEVESSVDDPENGSASLRMSLGLLALLHAVVLIFS